MARHVHICPVEEDLGVLMEMSQQCAPADQKASDILGCINMEVAAGRGRGVSCSALLKPRLELCVQA